MAERAPFFMDISNAYSGDELALPYRDIVAEGIVTAAALAVTATAPASLSIDIAAGPAWVLGDTNPDLQPCYRIFNDGVINKGISPDPSNPRKVLVVAQITDEAFAGVGRKWETVAIHGAPAAVPLEPALPASATPLALVDVPANAPSIVAANITDRRRLAGIAGQLRLTGRFYEGATPPANPQDGDLWLLDLGGSTRWVFRYNAGSASTHKWEFLGGPPVRGHVAAAEALGSANAWTNLATVGPSFAVPRAGDYHVDGAAWARNTEVGRQMMIGAAINDGTPVAPHGYVHAPGANYETNPNWVKSTLACVAGDAIRMRYFQSGGSTTFTHRALSVMPVRVS